MENILGVIRGGRVELDVPARLPDGTRVRVEPADEANGFIREVDWPTTAEGIAELIRRMESIEPLTFTADEEQQIADARAAVRESSKAAVRKQMGLDP